MTNPTAAEIAALERRIAEGVMGWRVQSCGPGMERQCWVDDSGEFQNTLEWSPWHNPADALDVLERLSRIAGPKAPWTRRWRIEKSDEGYTVALLDVLPQPVAFAPGPHFGPAVCLLAEKVMGESLTDSRNRL